MAGTSQLGLHLLGQTAQSMYQHLLCFSARWLSKLAELGKMEQDRNKSTWLKIQMETFSAP